MNRTYAFKTISRATFDSVLKKYPEVLPGKLIELDNKRYKVIPETVKQRKDASDAHLTKDEALTLVIWKVSHGKFRPTLRSLFQENSEDTVVNTTKEAFAAYKSPTPDAAKRSLDILTKLRGIGPATASLLLSVYDPETAPFFSVGIFGWAMDRKNHGRDWEQGIKYNIKEYLEIFSRVQELRGRLDVAALDIEKAGYAIGKAGLGSDNDGDEQAASEGKKRKVPPQGDAQDEPKKDASTKRASERKRSKK